MNKKKWSYFNAQLLFKRPFFLPSRQHPLIEKKLKLTKKLIALYLNIYSGVIKEIKKTAEIFSFNEKIIVMFV